MPRLSRETPPATADRPAIWIEGRQQPKFDLRAWAGVGHAMARRWLVPHLQTGSVRLSVWGDQIAAGRYQAAAERLGRVGQNLPSRRVVGGAVTGLSARLADAKLILDPAQTQSAPLAYPDMIRASEPAKPQATAATISPRPAPAPHAAELEPTLSAIRAVLRGLPAEEPARPQPAPAQVMDPPKNHAVQNGLGLLFARGLSHLIAYGALLVAMPVGLVQATLFHLNGGDLTDWD